MATEKKTCAIFYIFIGNQTVIINANPMRLVQQRYSIECTRGIGFASVVTILMPMRIKNSTVKFFLVDLVEFFNGRTKSTNTYGIKNLLFFEPPEIGTRHIDDFKAIFMSTSGLI